MRQGLLSEPEASSGPAAMLLAASRSPSSIPRRSPCPERCHLPLASLSPSPPDRCHLSPASCYIHLTKPQKHPRLHPPSDTIFLWRPSTTSIHTKKSPASSYSKDTGLPSVIYKLEMRLELTTPSLRVKCSTD